MERPEPKTLLIAGKRYRRIPYGKEKGAGGKHGPALGHVLTLARGGQHTEANLQTLCRGCQTFGLGGATCKDCGVAVGDVHFATCDQEECPRCGWQLISCDCFESE